MCWEFWEYRFYMVVFMEKVVQFYREKILNYLSILRRDRDKIQGFQVKGEVDILVVLKKFQDQRQYIVVEFEQGYQFLREWEEYLLEQLVKLEQEFMEGREKFKSWGVGEFVWLVLVIFELEGKVQQLVVEFMQDMRDFLNRYLWKKFWVGKFIV